MATEKSDEDVKAYVIASVSAKHSDAPIGLIAELVDEEFATLAERPVRTYVPILTERAVKARLRKLVSA